MLTVRPQQLVATGQSLTPANQALLEKIVGAQPRELFPGALLAAQLVTSMGVGFAGVPAIITNTLTTAANMAQQISQGGSAMALNLGNLLGTAGSIIGGINTSGLGNISQIIGGGLQLAGAAFAPSQAIAPQPAATYAPAYGYSPPSALPARSAQPVMSMAPTIVGSMALVRQITAPILAKMYMALGRRYSLNGAIALMKKMGKFFSSPEAIALYLGITVSEMAQLITANAGKKRRRMNPANPNALRRAARRIKGFHRMASHIDLLKGRGRRSTSRSSCSTCKKSPCRC
jgi:hypothetical protein